MKEISKEEKDKTAGQKKSKNYLSNNKKKEKDNHKINSNSNLKNLKVINKETLNAKEKEHHIKMHEELKGFWQYSGQKNSKKRTYHGWLLRFSEEGNLIEQISIRRGDVKYSTGKEYLVKENKIYRDGQFYCEIENHTGKKLILKINNKLEVFERIKD